MDSSSVLWHDAQSFPAKNGLYFNGRIDQFLMADRRSCQIRALDIVGLYHQSVSIDRTIVRASIFRIDYPHLIPDRLLIQIKLLTSSQHSLDLRTTITWHPS